MRFFDCRKSPLSLAGREGLEPSNARSKAWCLTSLATAQQNCLPDSSNEITLRDGTDSKCQQPTMIRAAGDATILTQIGDQLAATCYETTFWRSGVICSPAQCGCRDFRIAMLFMADFGVNLNRNQRLSRTSYSHSRPLPPAEGS
jgi:hypothetical protein